MAVPYTFGTATAAIPLSQLDSNFSTAVTIGNTAVQLGNTVTSFGNVTLTNVTISSGNVIVTGANVSGTANVSTLVVTGSETVSGNTAVTGNITASFFTSTSTFGFKNRIINGQMQIAQRATSATITAASTIAAGYSTVDRFYVYCTGANVTAAQVAGSGATKNRLQITGAASVTAVGIGQRIEQLNSYDLAGSTATLSADLAISATLTTVTWTASYATTTADTFGTLASPTVTQIATGTFTVTSTVTNFSTNITIPAAATTGIQIVFTVGALTAGLTWTVGNVQLEKGSTATSFDYRPYGTELALCQRYYSRMNANTGVYTAFGSGIFSGATGGNMYIKFPTTMRSSPTINQSNCVISDTVTSPAITAVSTTFAGTDSAFQLFTVASGGTLYRPAVLVANNNTAAYIDFSSEL